MNQVYKLFTHCLPVKGAIRSLIYDIQRNEKEFIPNGLYDILMEYKTFTIDQLKQDFEPENHSILEEYVQFLLQHEFIFLTDHPEQFPDLDLTWHHPSPITNAIIDVEEHSTHDYKKIFQELEDLSCKAIQFRFFYTIDVEELKAIIDLTKINQLDHISLLLKYNKEEDEEHLLRLAYQNQRIHEIVIHSAPKDQQVDTHFIHMAYIQQVITSHHHCGAISPGYLVTNQPFFNESQQFNTCLNRKIGIDVNGNIKNCPSLEQSFGNIKDTSLHNALTHKNFKDLWEINKDQIEVCKDCEFRHSCTDCRAFITDPKDIYSKPAKCTYDPYTATWGDNKEIQMQKN